MNDTEIKVIWHVLEGHRDRLAALEETNKQLVDEWIKEKERNLKWQRSVEEKVLRWLDKIDELKEKAWKYDELGK